MPEFYFEIWNINKDRLLKTLEAEAVAETIGKGTNTKTRTAEQHRINVGQRIIKAGKATTTFVPSLAGTKVTVKRFEWKGPLKNNSTEQLRYVQGLIRQFNELMKKNGYTVNNHADKDFLVYVLAYELKYNKKPDADKLKQMRQELRQGTLNSPQYQGMTNVEKQASYEEEALIVWRRLRTEKKPSKRKQQRKDNN
jgi:hypothetical protein